MLQFSDNFENIRERLVSLGYSGLREDDESLIQALVAVHLTLESFELSEGAQGAILDLLSANGRDAMKSTPVFSEEDWIDFDYGNVTMGDFVRVKVDAYDSESGSRHNGLVGIMTYMYGGNCTVNYIGLATGNSQKHPVSKLDSLKGVYNRRPSKNN